jgi:hypothetical protein
MEGALGRGAVRSSAALALVVATMAAPGIECTPAGSSSSANSTQDDDGGVPSCIDDQLSHTQVGNLPVLAAIPIGANTLVIGYDPTLNDAITQWGSCMDLVTGCYTSTTGPVTGCIEALPTCPGSDPTTGGAGCCPKQCLADFQTQVDAGAPEDQAVWSTIGAGTGCVAGFAQMMSAAGVSP